MATRLVPSVCPYCAVGCGLYVRTEDGQARAVEFMTEHPVTHGRLCPKGVAALEFLRSPERLTRPLRRKNGRLVPVSWGEALETVARELRRVREAHGPDALGFISSSQCTNEENYLVQKLARLLGTNNVDNCARLCQTPSVHALRRAVGMGAACTSAHDLLHSRLLLFIGANPAEAHPVLFQYPILARQRGTTVVMVDPRRTISADMADVHLPVRPGTDLALLLGMARAVLDEGLEDREFVAQRTAEFEPWRRSLEGVSVAWAAATCGLEEARVRDVARRFATSGASSILVGQGVTEHRTATATVAAAANLALLTGNYGRPGTGVSPLRGQTNVQGACDVGALAEFYPGYVALPAEASRLEHFAAAWGVAPDALPRQPGLTNVELCQAVAEGRVRAVYVVGENCFASLPDLNKLAGARERLEFLAVQDVFLTETAQHADVVLPAAAWAEKEGSVTNTERRVQWRHQAAPPPGEARPDWRIVCDLARHLGLGEHFPYRGPEEVLREINRTVPAYGGVTPERLKGTVGGIQWPCPTPHHPGTPVLYLEGFATPDGKAHFTPLAYEGPAEEPDEAYPFTLTSARTVLLYNTSAMTSRSPSLAARGRFGSEGYVEVSAEDAARLGVEDGDRVRVASRRGEVELRAAVTERVPPGVLHAPFHLGGINRLTLAVLDPTSKTPEYKVCAVRLERVG